MAVEIRLLGGVEVRLDGRLVDTGHARQRCVLVALLLEPNRVVPVDQLLDRVWGDRPPQRARSGLSSYVSRLRQVLATGDGVTISRRAGGYLATVDPMVVDLHRFRHLVAQAHATDDPDRAERLLDDALRLWRGEAFATLDTPWLTDVRTGLRAERLAAELDHNDRALELGRDGPLLAQIWARTAECPWDERLAAQLMLALYRSGRQAEALHRYEQIRRALADELGTDPGPRLRRLHRQILTGDPALAGATGPAQPESPVPRQLPAPPRSFIGRAAELATLDKVAQGRGGTLVISAVSGTAGVGKTALAVHWAHRVAERFADGQLYVNLRGFDPAASVLEPAEAVRDLLDALGVPAERIPASLAAQIGLYRSIVADKRMLLVLDNARDVEHVRPLLPGAAGCLVVVTSRNQLAGLVGGEGAHLLDLDVLSPAEAVDLFAARLGRERVEAEPDAVREIVFRCARLPLALSIVAARAATHPDFSLAALGRELTAARTALHALAAADPGTDLRAVFSWSYRTLSDRAARLFRLLGVHSGPDFSAPAAGSLAGLPESKVSALLGELVHGNLITEHQPGRYTFHDLLRSYAADLADNRDSESERRHAIHRLLDHYVHTGHTAARLLNPALDPIAVAAPQPGAAPEALRSPGQALSWFAVELPVMHGAVRLAAAAGFDVHACQLAWTLDTFLNRRGRWHDLAAAGHTALASARRLADLAAQARAYRMLARADIRLDRLDDAHHRLRQALDLYRQADNRAGQAHIHTDLALLWERRDRHAAALEHAELALALLRATGDRQWQAVALNLVGWYRTHLGDHQRALSACRQSLALHRELGNSWGQAATLDSLGYAHHHAGQYRRAVTSYRLALDLLAETGDRPGEAETLTHLGETHRADGDIDAARAAWQRALTILTELDHPDADQVRARLRDLPPTGT